MGGVYVCMCVCVRACVRACVCVRMRLCLRVRACVRASVNALRACSHIDVTQEQRRHNQAHASMRPKSRGRKGDKRQKAYSPPENQKGVHPTWGLPRNLSDMRETDLDTTNTVRNK